MCVCVCVYVCMHVCVCVMIAYIQIFVTNRIIDPIFLSLNFALFCLYLLKENIIIICRFSGAYSIDVIAITSFGVKVDCQKDRNNAYVTNAKRAFDLKFWFLLKSKIHSDSFVCTKLR